MSIPILPLTHSDFAQWIAQQDDKTRHWVKANGFRAEVEQMLVLPGADGQLERVLCGLGERARLYAMAKWVARLPVATYHLEGPWPDAASQQLALGFELARYHFSRYVKAPTLPKLSLPEDEAGRRLHHQVETIYQVRDLVNTPAQDMNPEHLEQVVAALAKEYDGRFEAIVGDDLLVQNFPAVHAVGRAAAHPPRLLRMRWGEPKAPRLALVGKGVCFDSGGLNLKGPAGMRWMKKDMGGAAHAIGLARLLMAEKLPLSIDLIIPAVENAISSQAYRPGDVIATRAGKTVEVGNTDAEGRLILADGLALAAESDPALIIDFATLTGAARIALGDDVTPLFCTHTDLAQQLIESGESLEDPIWRMPLYQPYADLLRKNPVAEIGNIAEGGSAGCILAALFLQQFVPNSVPWCHFDVFAWNRSDRPGRPMGGEAQTIRAVFNYLCNQPSLTIK